MTQSTPTIGSNKSGLQYRTEDNDGKKALLNHHKGSSAPSYAEAGVIWLDDAATPWVLKVYDGTDWIKLGDVNATANTFNPYVGTATSRLLNDAADTGIANAYAVAPVPAITAYAAGQIVLLKPAQANTGASTLAVNGLAAKNIKLLDGNNPASGALATTGVYQLVYDGTNFVLLNAHTNVIDNSATITVKDANLTIQDDGDTTKQVKFQVSGVTTATTRTLTVPDKNGTIATTSDTFTAAQLPAGTIVDRAYASYSTNTSFTAVIPGDDTIPQNTEGTQILSASITPKSTTNRIRATFLGWGGSNTATYNIVAALFVNSTASAVQAMMGGNNDLVTPLTFSYEYVPGTTSTQTLNVRVGPSSAGTAFMHGNTATSRYFGGAASSTLILEEIVA